MPLDYIEQLNEPVFKLDDSHPAKRFLSAFMDCQADCAGLELEFEGRAPIEQAWTSATDGRTWTFSGYIYSFICFDIELDGFLQNAPTLTTSELADQQALPRMKTMMHECADAARKDANDDIIELNDQVLEMLDLWQTYLDYREETIASMRR